MKTYERCYSFPSSISLDRFMHSFDNWSGYTVDSYYGPNSKSGNLTVSQALPFMQARVPWRISGNSVYFDFTFPIAHFDEFRLNQIFDHLLEQANLFGANLSRSPY